MPQFEVQFDGIGFTPRKSLTELGMSSEQATRFTQKLIRSGELPPGVKAVCRADTSPDGGKEDGMYKVFVGIALLVEAKDLDSAEKIRPPEALLMKVADKLVKGDAEAELGLGGSFELLSADEHQADALPEDDQAAKKKKKSVAKP